MKWTKKEEDVLKKLYPRTDIPVEEILKVFPGRSWESIARKASSLSLHRRNNGKVDQEQLFKLEKIYKI